MISVASTSTFSLSMREASENMLIHRRIGIGTYAIDNGEKTSRLRKGECSDVQRGRTSASAWQG
jgi:hypothetical protein